MGSPPNPLCDFCGFVNGSCFRTEYFTMRRIRCGGDTVHSFVVFSVSNLIFISA
ncbi:hypothetical protein ANCCAN_24556 [Ancylostoma caninum]|uniref:Uncharacterized protein n=1 Tax=Ancylostoma caninum TaxID=29170 RepID=A0A368FFT0_ANCCA|nr:hypothetical protein ANCCAN_24556 [Ancylostoma caninum]